MLLVVAAHVALILSFAGMVERLLGPVLATIFKRVMGLSILAIAFELMMDGVAARVPSLGSVPGAGGALLAAEC